MNGKEIKKVFKKCLFLNFLKTVLREIAKKKFALIKFNKATAYLSYKNRILY